MICLIITSRRLILHVYQFNLISLCFNIISHSLYFQKESTCSVKVAHSRLVITDDLLPERFDYLGMEHAHSNTYKSKSLSDFCGETQIFFTVWVFLNFFQRCYFDIRISSLICILQINWDRNSQNFIIIGNDNHFSIYLAMNFNGKITFTLCFSMDK